MIVILYQQLTISMNKKITYFVNIAHSYNNNNVLVLCIFNHDDSYECCMYFTCFLFLVLVLPSLYPHHLVLLSIGCD